MPRYTVRLERAAETDLTSFKAAVRAAVIEQVERLLQDQPIPEPGHEGQRKALDANPLGADYRVRIGAYRAYYIVDAEAATVSVLRVGYKPKETVYLRGKPAQMRD